MSDVTEQELRAFVGKKERYYLTRWRAAFEHAESPEKATGFNWAAFFFSGLWLPYRRMYRATAILFGVILLESLLEEVIYVGFLGKSEAPGYLTSSIGLIVSLACGRFDNEWYLSHARKIVLGVRSRGLSGEAHLRALTRRGGVSIAASLGSLAIFFVAGILVVAMSELLLGVP